MKFNLFRWLEFDVVDYFLLSAWMGSLLIYQLYPELQEEASMVRLKNDLINKSPLVKSSGILFSKESVKSINTRKIFKTALNSSVVQPAIRDTRGVDFNINSNLYISELLSNLVVKFQAAILILLASLKNKESYATAAKAFGKQMFSNQLRRKLQLLLSNYKIYIRYQLAGNAGPELIAVAVFAGSATGMVSVWMPLIRYVLGPTAMFSALVGKKVMDKAFSTEKIRLTEVLNDKEIDQHLRNLLIQTQEEFTNSNKITMRDLNWNKDLSIKKSAQRLNVFQTAPNVAQKLSLDPSDLDPTLTDLFKEFGIGQIETKNISIRPKSKVVLFRDFIRSTDIEKAKEFLNDLEVLEADKLVKLIRIKTD